MIVAIIIGVRAAIQSHCNASHKIRLIDTHVFLQCFDAVGWAAGRSSGL